MGNSKVLPCTCKHDFQDQEYGQGLRLFTVGGDKLHPKYCCTVCGAKK